MSLPIIYAPTRGGSARGMSWYEKAASFCPRKAVLDDQMRAEAEEEGVEYKPNGGNSDIGTCFHLLAEHFYKGTITSAAAQVSDIDWGGPFEKARKMFEFYLKHFPKIDTWGTVLAVEGDYESTDPLYTFGVKRFTGQIDLVVDMGQEQCDWLREHTSEEKLDLDPGVYILDWKTTGKARPGLQYRLRQQFQAYALLYEECTGVTPLGTIAVEPFISTAKTPNHKIRTYFAEYPDADEVLGLKKYLQTAEQLVNNGAPCLGRGHGCMTYGRICGHYEAGRCERI